MKFKSLKLFSLIGLGVIFLIVLCTAISKEGIKNVNIFDSQGAVKSIYFSLISVFVDK